MSQITLDRVRRVADVCASATRERSDLTLALSDLAKVGEERAMKSLARYRLADHARQEFDTLSGGQKARLEILCLELEGHNVLLLDEPTDKLDIESSEALEHALDGFVGTVVAVSRDPTFLAGMDRYIMVGDDGSVHGLPDFDLAMAALAKPEAVGSLRLAKPLTTI